jgi:hypothetical protein
MNPDQDPVFLMTVSKFVTKVTEVVFVIVRMC